MFHYFVYFDIFEIVDIKIVGIVMIVEIVVIIVVVTQTWDILISIFTRPGVAGAVLQSASSFIH